MENNFEIHCSDEIVIVRLNEKFCSCKMWTLTGIPCFHALACIRYNREDPIHYVDKFYHRSNCLAAYNHYLSPIYGPKDWPSIEGPPILPPPFVRQPGRLKKNRRRALDEETSRSKHKLTNKGINIACTKCRQFGHNKRSCKEPELVQQGPLEQRARGRPRKDNSTVLERRDLRQARSGFGVFTGQSGNLYVRTPGARNPRVIRQNEDVVGSQQSQVLDGSSPT